MLAKIEATEFPRACPEDSAGFLSRLTLAWVGPFFSLLSRGNASLSPGQLWPLAPCDTPEQIFSQFDELWKARMCEGDDVNARRKRLRSTLWHLSWRRLAWAGAFKVLYYPLSVSCPLIVRELFLLFEARSAGRNEIAYLWYGVLLVVLLLLLTSLGQLGIQQYFFRCSRLGVVLRTKLCYAVQAKTMRVQCGLVSDGEVCILMSADTDRVLVAAPMLQYLWCVPVH